MRRFFFSTVGNLVQYKLSEQIGFLEWGQSNAGDVIHGGTPALTSPIVGAFAGVTTASGDHYHTLDYPTNNAQQDYAAELNFCNAIVSEYGKPIFYENMAEAGAPLFQDSRTNFSPLETNPAWDFYQDLKNKFLRLKARIVATGKTPIIISYINHGESHTLDLTKAQDWGDYYQDIVDQLEIDGVTIDYHLISILSETSNSGTLANRQAVRASQLAWVAAHPNARSIDMDGRAFIGDGVHFTGAAQDQIGLDLSDIVINDIFTGGQEVVTGYSTAANAVLTRMNNMSSAWQTAIADFIDVLNANANLGPKILEIQDLGLDTMGNSGVGFFNRFHGWHHGGTFDDKVGITYNGTDEWIDHGFHPQIDGAASGGLYSLNQGGFGWYVVDNLDTGDGTLGGIFASNGRANAGQAPSVTAKVMRVHQSGAATNSTETTFADDVIYTYERTASTGANAIRERKNGTSFYTGSNTSTNLPSGSFAGAALNDEEAGTPGIESFLNVKLGLFVVFNPSSFDFSGFNTAFRNYLAAKAAI